VALPVEAAEERGHLARTSAEPRERPNRRLSNALVTVVALAVIAALFWLLYSFGFSGGGA
jgi:hypothetical protein